MVPLSLTGVSSHSLFQGIFPTQGSNPGLPHCRGIFYQLSHQGILKENFQMPQTTQPLKTPSQGTPVVVQWLRLHLPMQGVWVQSLVRELRSRLPCGQKTKHKKQKHYCNKFNKCNLKMVRIKKKKKKKSYKKPNRQTPPTCRSLNSHERHSFPSSGAHVPYDGI